MDAKTDKQLISDHLKGDQAALRELFDKHLSSVYNFVFRVAPNGIEAEDIVQEAFIKVWQNLKNFRPDGSFRNWVLTIAKNTLFDALRKRRIPVFSELEKAGEESSPELDMPDPRPLPSEEAERSEAVHQVEEALGSLDPGQKTVVVLHALEGLTFQEIGDMNQEPMDTVKTRYRRALRKMAAYLTSRAEKK